MFKKSHFRTSKRDEIIAITQSHLIFEKCLSAVGHPFVGSNALFAHSISVLFGRFVGHSITLLVHVYSSRRTSIALSVSVASLALSSLLVE